MTVYNLIDLDSMTDGPLWLYDREEAIGAVCMVLACCGYPILSRWHVARPDGPTFAATCLN